MVFYFYKYVVIMRTLITKAEGIEMVWLEGLRKIIISIIIIAVHI